ncbi:MAG: T9SS type A sorting domain-containing protein [Patiriisocius sp.]|uniref:T9SS type A sorting domain-containing protein n=1 Tax=Patiriisocius sp. TaxID=2822396 RepID=UPI003EF7390F
MKKIYILAIVAFGFAFTSNAQLLEDNMEDYLEGDISPQSPIWRTWSGDEVALESADVVTEQANDGTFSMRVNNEGAPAGIDQLLVIPAQTGGVSTLKFMMYVPSGQSGYFNLQGEITTPQTGVYITQDLYFNQNNGAPGQGTDGTNTWSFPHDAWFEVGIAVDVDNNEYKMVVDGAEAIPAGTGFNDGTTTFGGADFYATDASTLYYIDTVSLESGDTLGAEDFNADVFSVYPNPVVDILNIKSAVPVDAVVVYDILGKVVAQSSTKTVDMSGLSSGAYLVNVTIGDTSKTIKVIK